MFMRSGTLEGKEMKSGFGPATNSSIWVMSAVAWGARLRASPVSESYSGYGCFSEQPPLGSGSLGGAHPGPLSVQDITSQPCLALCGAVNSLPLALSDVSEVDVT